MNLTPEELALLDRDAARIGMIFHLDTVPKPVRLWGGIGPCRPGINVMDALSGATYSGFGELSNVPDFQQLINGAGQRIEFMLSGVSQDVANIAAVEDASKVKNRDCALGFFIMDADWQQAGSAHWPFRGIADFLGVVITGASEPGGDSTRAIKLSVGSGQTGRKRRGFAYWTDQDHQRRSPGDRFCEFVVKISMVARKVWPKF
ncbi:MAG: hypothetical protein WBF99_06445 [Xanthobacteraceae bacterium]